MENMMEFSLIWGMRVISALLILIAGWIIGQVAQKKIAGFEKMDATLTRFLGGFSKYAILSVAIVAVLGQFGIQTASFIAVLGAAGLAIGLALQGTLSNVAAGMMLLLLRPFKVGDYITYGSDGGTVESLNLFGTELATPDNVYIFAPNSTIWNSTIKNYSRHKTRRHDFIVGISYSDPIDKAFKIIDTVISKDERVLKDDSDKAPQIMVDEMAQSAIHIRIRLWCKSEDYWPLKWDMTKAFKEALDEAGLTIPYPTRTVEIIGGQSINDDKKAKAAAAS
mgnify:CR=1 FL=1